MREWAEERGVDLGQCHACSDSIFDVPLLSSVGCPHAVNPDPSLTVVAVARRWPIEHWDRPPGVPSVLGFEPYHLLRPFVRPLSFPYARFDMAGLENVPPSGAVLWPPTTGATSTWRRWRWWPAASVGPCASWARRRSSTRRSSA